MLSEEQIRDFRRTGHLTVPDVFSADTIAAAICDVETWSGEFLKTLSSDQEGWYLEKGTSLRSGASERPQLRKLDNPVFHRPLFRDLASDPKLIAMVQSLIGNGVSVFFSQVFLKPPGIGGPKPIHQDNFYFGPDDPDATLTAWIALDDATIENGCLHYATEHQPRVVPHVAPPDEPFNLQVPTAGARFEMVPEPVPSGGVSFHHGNTPHQSSNNRSNNARRAAALHYLRGGASLVNPALPYDQSINVPIT